MADFSGYIRLQDGTDKLFWNEIDIEGSPAEYVNPYLWTEDMTVYTLIFYVNPPSIPVDPTDPTDPIDPSTPSTRKRTNYFQSDRVRVFQSERTRVFRA